MAAARIGFTTPLHMLNGPKGKQISWKLRAIHFHIEIDFFSSVDLSFDKGHPLVDKASAQTDFRYIPRHLDKFQIYRFAGFVS